MDNMSANERQAVATHELGHALSLYHVSLTGGVHIMYGDPAYVARTYGIMYSTQHDIAAINARY